MVGDIVLMSWVAKSGHRRGDVRPLSSMWRIVAISAYSLRSA